VVESRTKAPLSRDEVERLVSIAFGARLLAAEELTDGYFNSAFLVHFDAEPGRAVLKVAPPPDGDVLTYERDLMRAEIEAMGIVAHDPRISAPRLLFADSSRTVLPSDYLFMSVVDGRPWGRLRDTLTLEQNARVERRLGQITAAINSFERESFGYPIVGPRFVRWTEAFRWMNSQLIDDAHRFGVVLGFEPSELFDLMSRHQAIFDEVTSPRLVHWDLWAGNVFLSTDAEAVSVSGVIDFERALWGDPLMEFIPGRLGDIAAYESGYGRPLLATRAERLRRVFYNVYLGLVLVVEDGPRRYADKSTVTWGRGLIERGLVMLRHGDVIRGLTAYA
jgi:aminoglycoside phosphotransferase (APT) family kinase protein